MTKLEYFKNEIIKILDRQEQEDNAISKSIECFEYVKSLSNTMGIIEKSQKMFSTWKINGKDVPVKKIAPGKWVRIYTEKNNAAKESIKRLKNRVRKAANTDDLLEIVMNNVHRFQDENGVTLDLVYELQREIQFRKDFINKKNPGISSIEFKNFITWSMDAKNRGKVKAVDLGYLSDSTQQKLLDKGYYANKVEITNGEIYHALKETYHNIGDSDLLDIMNIINNPDNVIKSKEKHQNNPVIKFEKNINGKDVKKYVMEFRAKKGVLHLVTAYIKIR